MESIQPDDNVLQELRGIVDSCLNNTPVIILGSGSSAAYGIHTMDSLAERIVQEVSKTDAAKNNPGHWKLFTQQLSKTGNLEKSIEGIENSTDLISEITITTWGLITEQDQNIFENQIAGNGSLALSQTIESLSNGTGPSSHVKIITTNYDRLAEYSCEFIQNEYREYLHYTGFNYGLLRKPDETFLTAPSNVSRRILNTGNTVHLHKIVPVEILKVHGSIDWHELEDGRIIALPSNTKLPESAVPAIITPGKQKYQRTHTHPYSMIIEAARLALENANSYLAIGFGFRDSHIHTNLEKKLRSQRRHKPFVVLAKRLTDETKALFIDREDVNNFVLMEEDEAQSTKVFKKSSSNTLVTFTIPNKSLWDLDQFNNVFINGGQL